MQGPGGKVHCPAGASEGRASRNPWRVSMSKQQSAMIAKPGMQCLVFAESESTKSGFVSAAKRASMLLKKRSLIRLSNTPIPSAHAFSSEPSSLCESSSHLFLENPKQRSAFILVPGRGYSKPSAPGRSPQEPSGRTASRTYGPIVFYSIIPADLWDTVVAIWVYAGHETKSIFVQ